MSCHTEWNNVESARRRGCVGPDLLPELFRLLKCQLANDDEGSLVTMKEAEATCEDARLAPFMHAYAMYMLEGGEPALAMGVSEAGLRLSMRIPPEFAEDAASLATFKSYQANLAYVYGVACAEFGDVPKGLTWLTKASELFQELGDTQGYAAVMEVSGQYRLVVCDSNDT